MFSDPFTLVSDPFTLFRDPLTPFGSECVENDQRFVRHPTAVVRGLPCTPVPLYPYTPIC
eukprot:13327421-Heterocapsa_arctica.AAC.1